MNRRVLWIGAAMCAVGFMTQYLAFAPGSLSYDSTVQLEQAISGRFKDSHPPVMAWLWSWIIPIERGPRPMLIVQLAALWGGLFLIFLTKSTSRWALLIPAVGFVPWVSGLSGVIWKDVGMAASWLLCIGILMQPRLRAAALLAAPFFLYGALVRTNAIFGALPILYLLAGRITKGWKQFALASCLLIAMAGATPLINNTLIGAEKERFHTGLFLDDLHAISLATGKNLFPPSVGVTDSVLAACADSYVWLLTCYQKAAPEKFSRFFFVDPPETPLFAAWRQAIKDHPLAYLQHRTYLFAYLLGLAGDRNLIAYWTYSEDNLGHPRKANALTAAYETTVGLTMRAAQFTYRIWFWLALPVVMLTAILWLRIRNDVASALLWSSIFYIAGYFPITVSNDYRYAYWSIVATLVATMLILPLMVTAWRPSTHRQTHPIGRHSLVVQRLDPGRE